VVVVDGQHILLVMVAGEEVIVVLHLVTVATVAEVIAALFWVWVVPLAVLAVMADILAVQDIMVMEHLLVLCQDQDIRLLKFSGINSNIL
jgi:hypothetical protein